MNQIEVIEWAIVGQGSDYHPLHLGVKLLRWYHPNDPSQVTEAGGLISALADKGTKGVVMVGEGTPNPSISDGEVSFDGVDQALVAADGFSDAGSEFFAVMKSTGTFQIMSGNSTHTIYFGLNQRLVIAEMQGGVHTNVIGTNRQLGNVDIGSNVFGLVGMRTTGSAYIININGTDYLGATLTDNAGLDNGDWVEDLSAAAFTNIAIGLLRRTTDAFYLGVLGKAGLIETSPLTTQERTDLINWMKTESGIA